MYTRDTLEADAAVLSGASLAWETIIIGNSRMKSLAIRKCNVALKEDE